MKQVLILGVGYIARPLIECLAQEKDIELTLVDSVEHKLLEVIDAMPRTRIVIIDVRDKEQLKKLIAATDLVISLVPYVLHSEIATLCVEHKKHMITASYVSPEMSKLDLLARNAGVLLLNEVGLDPGIDHMSAMRTIDMAHDRGEKIIGFRSYCGGLPAPDVDNNPFGYKFSWSPKGVLMAGRNSAKYLRDRETVEVPSEALFNHYETCMIEGLGEFEVYPNRDSISYIKIYKIPEVETMYRGTLRNKGWCGTFKKIVELGLLDDKTRIFKHTSYDKIIADIIGYKPGRNLKDELAKYLNIEVNNDIMERLEWLGLLSNTKMAQTKTTFIDILTELMLQKMSYKQNERDMIILYHEFFVHDPKKSESKRIFSTLIDYGVSDGHFAMARTVAFPCAIAAKLILQGKIRGKGVTIPTDAAIYSPILDGLKQFGIDFIERTVSV